MKKRVIIPLAILIGFILSLPLTYVLIQNKAKNRGVVVNEWRVSFRTGNFGNNFLLRAAIALASLGNAVPEEAMFFHGYFDAEGDELDGEESYSLTFENEELPPVDAFWSVTVYDAASGFLTHNELDRYTLGDRSESLVYNSDGSLTILFSHDAPSEQMLGNWVPVPDKAFSVTLRCYLPKAELLNLSWKPPGIQRDQSTEGR